MIKCKIATREVNKIPLMGLIHPSTFKENLPFEYFFIIEIKNYFDLSFKKYGTVYLLFETNDDYWNGKSRFCVVSETDTFISSNKYTNLNFFYKGESICKLDDKFHIINLNEELLRGPLDDLWEDENDLYDNFRELMRCEETVRINFHQKSIQNEKMSFCDDTFPVEQEIELGHFTKRFQGVSTDSYDFLANFNNVGICVFKQGNKFGFLNRYLFEIADDFDYIFNEEELLNHGIINKDPLIHYVEKDNKLFKIQLYGNFVDEITNYPSLFMPISLVQTFLPHRLSVDINKFNDRVYCSCNKYHSNDEFSIENDLEKFLFNFKFHLTSTEFETKNIADLVEKHTNLFGLIPSCYIVLEEIAISITKKQYDLIPFREGEKYGYKNHFQEVIVPCIYDFAEPIINGFGAVRLGDKWGGINGKYTNSYDSKFEYGDLMINCIYDSVGDFSEGLISVKKDDKWGFLDWESNTIVPPIYDKVKSFSEGFAAVMLDNKAGFINKKGEIISPLLYDDVGNFENGFSGVTFGDKYGMINTLGEEVTMMHFEQIVANSEDLFMVKLDDKVGFIDETWDWAVDNIYDMAFPFSEGLAVVVLNNKYGYVDKKGNIIIPLEFTDAYDFNSGIARVYKDGKFGFINPKGETVIPFIYDAAEDFNDGYATVKLDNFYGIINISNEVIIPFAYDYIHPDCFSDGLVAASSILFDGSDGIGYLNKSGEFVIRNEYSDVSSFTNGIALVVKNVYDVKTKEFNEIQGFIDKQGNEYWKH